MRTLFLNPYFKLTSSGHGARNLGHVGQPAIELEEDVYARSESEQSLHELRALAEKWEAEVQVFEVVKLAPKSS